MQLIRLTTISNYVLFYPVIIYRLFKSTEKCLVYNEIMSYIIWFLDIFSARLIDICDFEKVNSAVKGRL